MESEDQKGSFHTLPPSLNYRPQHEDAYNFLPQQEENFLFT